MVSWDERYSAEGYVYGTSPNRWVVEQAPRIRPDGRILSLGEGEGRNAVWLAEQGFRRIRAGAGLATWNAETFHTSRAEGHVDYPRADPLLAAG
jgi:hypothetical protein